jgi:two-component system, NarL family, nitrate/nitrite response regulator NarL
MEPHNDARGDAAVRVLIVDDHGLYRTGISTLLAAEDGIEVVAQASGGRVGVRLSRELRPDVVLTDLHMPDLDGVQATRLILAERPGTRVLVLTVASDEDEVSAALSAGANGFLLKDAPVDQVAMAVRAAADGSAWLSPRAAEIVLGRMRETEAGSPADSSLLEQLSPREVDVLKLLALGMENAQIADELEISPRTVKNHVSSVLAKLGLTSRLQAAIYAVRRGLA